MATALNLRNPSTTVMKENNERPIIYTFFQMKTRRDGFLDYDGQHEKILNSWADAWRQAGWDPRVLTLEDAKKHKDFKKYSDQFMKLKSTDSFIYAGSYNYMCLMRWLAMAALKKNAWMCDYDTFPLHLTVKDGLILPNDGKFTVYERFVPSLMSGNAEEWDRLAISVIEKVLEHFDKFGLKETYSDMYALEDVWHSWKKAYISERMVYHFPYSRERKVDCELTEGILAFHLSHASTAHARSKGLIPKTTTAENRADLYRILLEDTRQQCQYQFVN